MDIDSLTSWQGCEVTLNLRTSWTSLTSFLLGNGGGAFSRGATEGDVDGGEGDVSTHSLSPQNPSSALGPPPWTAVNKERADCPRWGRCLCTQSGSAGLAGGWGWRFAVLPCPAGCVCPPGHRCHRHQGPPDTSVPQIQVHPRVKCPPRHKCSQTQVSPDTRDPRHRCPPRYQCPPDTNAPRHKCPPDTSAPRYQCPQTQLPPRHKCPQTQYPTRHYNVCEVNCIMTFQILFAHILSVLTKKKGKHEGFPGGSDGKESDCSAADLGSVPGSGGFPGGENGNPLHCSCLENPMDREASLATLLGSQRVGHD